MNLPAAGGQAAARGRAAAALLPDLLRRLRVGWWLGGTILVVAGWAIATLTPSQACAVIGATVGLIFWVQSPGLAVYGLAAIAPFSLSFSVGGIDGVGLRDILLAALAVSALTTLAGGSTRWARFRAPRTKMLLILWAFLLVWGAITFLLGPANRWMLSDKIHNAWFVWCDIGRPLSVFPLVLACLDGRRMMERILLLLVLVGAGVAVNAILLAGTMDDNATGHFETGNALAGYLILILPLAAARLATTKIPWERAVCGVSTLLMLRALWLAGSRGGFVAFLVSMAVLACFIPRRRVAAVAVAGTAVLALVIGMRGGLSSLPMLERFAVLSDPKEVETFQWRQEQWGIFIQRIQDRPMLGYGSDVDESLKDLDRARTAHNAFLALSVKSGIPVAAAWACILILLAALGVRCALQPWENDDRPFWFALLAFLAALLTHNIVESTLLTPIVQDIFWIVTAGAMLLGLPSGRPADAVRFGPSPSA
ncbi:MAG TPA: O-antigen ligase family protein [Candidatus Polarisedimenticolia bacterium]|nr:O-antigen ligase family protein [Candidatus Polarisedimenticolia bacterium]